MVELFKYSVLWFINPLVLWLLLLFIGNKVREKNDMIKTFGRQINKAGLIHKRTIPYALLIGIILSLLFYIFEFSFSFNFILIYTTLVVLFTFTYELNKLSVLYTVGLGVVLYYFITQKHLIIMNESSYYLSVILLLVFLLVIEGSMYLISRPSQFQLQYRSNQFSYKFQKLMIVPIFINVPVDVMIDLGLSFLVIDGAESMPLLLPLVLAAEQKLYQVKDISLMRLKACGIYAIGLFLLLALLIPYELRLTLIMFSIVLRLALELIIYHKAQEKIKVQALEILWIEEGSLAEEFNLEAGQIITHVNHIKVDTKAELMALLLINEGQLILELKNRLDEKTKITVKSFQSDSELGIIVLGKPEVI